MLSAMDGTDAIDAAARSRSTVVDDWQPRADDWLRRGPSRFAGKAVRPLLVGACPRSGTTLLRALLNNHPDFAMPAETNFVLPLWGDRAHFGDLREESNRRRIAEWIFDAEGRGGRRIRANVFERDEAVARVLAAPPTLGSIFAALFEMYAEAKGKRRWGDKRPGYAGYVDALLALFPDAQFVNVIRDPRAACASQAQLGWYSEKPRPRMAAALATWLTAVRRVDRSARRLRSDQLLDIRYEDLVRDPRATLERVCEFAGLRTGDAIDEMITRPRRGVYDPGHQERLSEPITTAPVEGWRERLEPPEQALIEHAAADYFERFGYRRECEPGTRPPKYDLKLLGERLAYRRKKYRRYELRELARRHVTYRRPVAAVSSVES